MFSGLTEIVQTFLTAKPFVPFEIWVAGEGIAISNPELARAVDEDGATLALYDPEKDRTTLINMHAIDQVRIRGKHLKF